MKNIILTIAFLTIALTACKKDVADDYKLDTSSITLKVGQSHTFVMSKGGKEYNPNLFTWYSSNVEIGCPNGGGWFYAAKVGKCTIKGIYLHKATNEEFSASCEVIVTN